LAARRTAAERSSRALARTAMPAAVLCIFYMPHKSMLFTRPPRAYMGDFWCDRHMLLRMRARRVRATGQVGLGLLGGQGSTRYQFLSFTDFHLAR
jgi:hypothetical protein